MKQNLTPHLLIQIDDTLITPVLRAYLQREMLDLNRAVGRPQIFVASPVLDEEKEIYRQLTAEKYSHIISTVACYLTSKQFKYSITNVHKLYHPSIPAYVYYLKLVRLAHDSADILSKSYPNTANTPY